MHRIQRAMVVDGFSKDYKSRSEGIITGVGFVKRLLVLTAIPALILVATYCETGTAGVIKNSDAMFSWTTDTSTGLDWLDFDGGAAPATSQRSYNDVKSQLLPGGDYQGWRFASRSEVYQFVLNVTGLPSLTAAPNRSTSNDGATDLVATWTGYTRSVGTLDIVFGFVGEETFDGVFYAGLFDDYNYPGQAFEYTFWIPSGEVNRTAVYDDLGSWLVRGAPTSNVVPEPSSIAIWGIGAIGMGLIARRSSGKPAA